MGRIIPGEGEDAGREGPPVLPALAFLEIEENRRAPGAPGAPGEPGAPGGTRTRGNHKSPLARFSLVQRRRGAKNKHQVKLS